MNLKHKKRLYCLADSDELGTANFYYIENDVVKKQPFFSFTGTSNSPSLKHNPVGWKDEEIDFATSEQFKSLQRGFNIGLQFVYDGATIIRSRQYFGRGSEEIMYLVILRWDRSSDKYYLEYKGKFDCNTTVDTVSNSVQINTIEGGVLSYLNANKDTAYEIPIDDSNRAWKLLLLDGMNLSDSFNYGGYKSEMESFIDDIGSFGVKNTYWTFGLNFNTNEGDNSGVISGNPTPEKIGKDQAAITAYAATSGNYALNSLYGINNGTVNGEFDYKTLTLGDVANNPDYPAHSDIPTIPIDQSGMEANLYYFTSVNPTLQPLYTGNNNYPAIGEQKNIPFLFNITLAANEKLFLCVNVRIRYIFAPPIDANSIEEQESTFVKLSFISRKPETQTFCITLYDYWKQLVLKLTDGKYTGESSYLARRLDLVCACGDGLRNTDRTVIPNYLLSSSLTDFFQSVPGDPQIGSSCGIYARNNVLYLELLSDIYSDNANIYDLGNVSGFKIKAFQNQTNTITAGYPDQNYDTNGGKYEFNSGQVWQEPVLSVNKKFDISSKWRADARGIEAIRSGLTHLDTTDNSADKEPFIINVSANQLHETFNAQTDPEGADYSGQQWVVFDGAIAGNYMTTDSNKYIFTFNGNKQQADIDLYLYIDNGGHTCQVILFKNGQSIAIYTGNDTDGVTQIHLSVTADSMSLNDNYEIQITPFDAGFTNYRLVGASLMFDFLVRPYTLLRLPYTSITGVLDNTVFNVELRPRNQIFAHGNEIHEMLAQQNGYDLTLLSSDKNVSLSTTIGGVTQTENAPIPVASLARPLGLPYDFEFTTEVPYAFQDLLAMSTAGYFSFIANGMQFYALPRGSMKSTPANNGSQTWTLRAATRNLFSDFFAVSENDFINFTFNQNMIATSIYCPLHLIKYNFSIQHKYHQKDMYEDWSYQRFEGWMNVPFYAQKWQLDDIIKIPIITAGAGALGWVCYDVNGNQYTSGTFTIISAPSVRSPYTLQEADISLSAYDEGLYLFVVKAGDVNIWISEWCDIKEDHPNTLVVQYSHSKNELNLPWLSYNGFLELRCEALLEQWEPDSEATDYEDDYADFTILDATYLQKRNLIIGTTKKVPEWMGLKWNAILLKDKVYIGGTTSDSTKHYTRRASSQMETTKYNGMPYLSYNIEIIPAENPLFQVEENIPVNDGVWWHATIDAQVFGADYQDTEIEITEQ